MPYIYIDKVLNELRTELLSAMHDAVKRELRQGELDVAKLYRAFSRAAVGKCSNPVLISDKCVDEKMGSAARPRIRTQAKRLKGLGSEDLQRDD